MNTVDEIKQKLDIVELIEEYTHLQKAGRNFRANCPFHSEKTPSFFVFPEQQTWHCFGACGTGGDMFSFVMKKENMDFGQALRFLADKAGVVIAAPEPKNTEKEKQKEVLLRINESAAVYYHKLLLTGPSGEKARLYLNKRELSPEIIEKFQLGYSRDSYDDIKSYLLKANFTEVELLAAGLIIEKEGGGSYDRFRNRIMYPIWDTEGSVIGFGARALADEMPKYLNSPQTSVFDKSSCLYGIDKAKNAIRKENLTIIMEGYMDVLAAYQHGWENTVASMGTALNERQLVIIKKFTKNIILALDADMAGEEATMRVADSVSIENILKTEVKVAVPSHGKDPDEEIRNSPDYWKQSLANSKPLLDYAIELVTGKVNMDSARDKSIAAEKLVPLISKIDDPIRKGHYVQKLARLLRIDEMDIKDSLRKYNISKRRPQISKNKYSKPGISSGADKSSNLEEYCLWLLLTYPDLREVGISMPHDYFEHTENLEIFLKWLDNGNIYTLKERLDDSLQQHFDTIIGRSYPPTINENEEERLKVLKDCVTKLQERQLRVRVNRKRELLVLQATSGGEEEELKRLEELGIEENEKLRQIFTSKRPGRNQRV